MRNAVTTLLLQSLSIGASFTCMAQHHADVWYFGDGAGIAFQNCAAIAVTDGNNAGFEGCATICDDAGVPLFYTNSATVWNSAHAPMPNGSLVTSGGTLSQVLIVRQPGSDSLFHLFTVDIQGTPGAGHHHVVDMSLAGGMGDVLLANDTLTTLVLSEHVAATPHANGTDVWVLMHDYPGDRFFAWVLTSTGLSTTPVVSAVGPAFGPCASNINARGEMKFSLDGTRLALAGNGIGPAPGTDVLAVFDFDAATGMVSAPILLPPGRGDFGISFSPDGSKLYGSTWKAFAFTASDVNTLYQFDLSSNDSALIAASKQVLHTAAITQPFGSVQLAPDGRIYVAYNNSDSLGVINDPDLPAPACGYVHSGLYLGGPQCDLGLNNFVQYVNCGGISTSVDAPVAHQPVPWPDPVDDHFSITVQVPGMLRLIDPSGRVQLEHRVSGGTVIDAGTLAAGTYLLLLIDEDGTVSGRSRLVKQ